MENGNVLPEKLVRTYQKAQVTFDDGSLDKEMNVIPSWKVALYADAGSGDRISLANLEVGICSER